MSTEFEPATIVDDIDVATLRAKYAAERDKRFNPQRLSQFVEVAGEHRHFVEDPYIEQPIERAAVSEDVEVLIVGGGFGGMLGAVMLQRQGIEDIRIVEKAGDFGGTWYWNRYPGAQCDTESLIYMPLLEETGYIPTERYAHAEEIFQHAQRIGRHFGLYERALFQTQTQTMTWDEALGRWIVVTDRGDELRARFVYTANGPLSRPRLPGIPGISRFKGHMFHTSRWDYDYTGGDRWGGMTGLADKRVAVIGTGATAIQCVPYLAKDAKQLLVIQRTPSTVSERGNRPTPADFAAKQQPGWQRKRMRNFNTIMSGIPVEEDLIQDGWTSLLNDLVFSWMPRDGSMPTPAEMAELAEIADFRRGEAVRARVDQEVTKPEVAEKLKPWFGMRCKRPTFNDGYLPSFNRDNVTLVDTDGKGVEEITETSLVVNGVAYEVDCIIFATGFEVGTDYSRRLEVEIRGVGGETLSEHFAKGERTLHGFFVHGFPNFFMLQSGQNGFTPNAPDALTDYSEHLAGLIAAVRAKGFKRIEAKADAVEKWVSIINEKAQMERMRLASCTPGYYNGEGDVENGLFAQTYGGGYFEFLDLLQAWNNTGAWDGLQVS